MCPPPVNWTNALRAWLLCPSIGMEQQSSTEIHGREPSQSWLARTPTSKTWPTWLPSDPTALSQISERRTRRQQARLVSIKTLPRSTKTIWRSGSRSLKSLSWIEHNTSGISLQKRTGQYLRPTPTFLAKTLTQSWMRQRDIQEALYSRSTLSSSESLRGVRAGNRCMPPLTLTLTMLATHHSSITW